VILIQSLVIIELRRNAAHTSRRLRRCCCNSRSPDCSVLRLPLSTVALVARQEETLIGPCSLSYCPLRSFRRDDGGESAAGLDSDRAVQSDQLAVIASRAPHDWALVGIRAGLLAALMLSAACLRHARSAYQRAV
jgi:hypothetical protein